jgi:alanine racemase
MDMLIVDLSHIEQAEVGTEVELWGEHISVNEVAEMADTISYELLCNVKRAKFSYISK